MNSIIFIIIICSILALLTRLHQFAERPIRKEEQAERDRLARELAEEIERRHISEILSGDDVAPFALYLRPFALETIFREYREEILYPPTLLIQLALRRKVNFDLLLEHYFSSLDIELIGIGATNDKEGAGHVLTTDALWWERFRQLADRAQTIVVVPGVQPGIMAEIRWLRVAGLFVKTIFFKPKEYPEAEWRKMQELYGQEEGVELPGYTPKLLSFRMYSSGRCHEVLTWSTSYRPSKRRRGEAHMMALLSNEPIELD